MKKKVLLIVFSVLKHDARMLRHISFLKYEFDLTVLCIQAEPSGEYKVIQLPTFQLSPFRKAITGIFLLLRLYPIAYWLLYPYKSVIKALQNKGFDLIIANDVETLPLSFEIAQSSKVIFDAHEYAPRHFENIPSWRLFFQKFNIYLCKKYIPRVSAMITVGERIAEEYHTHFHVKPTVITNAPAKQNLDPRPIQSTIKLVHHGIGTPSRKIENMIEMMRLIPDHFELYLVLITPPNASTGTKEYINQLKSLASFTDRIHFIPPVTSDKILPLINQFDVGIISIPPVNFNYENTLPNKFFDCIQARLALAIGPTPEMAAIVTKFQLGMVAKDFSSASLAEILKELQPETIASFKNNTKAAVDLFNAEKNKEIFLRLIQTSLN